ncbi:MAG: LPXTG cell wall anchor domain-containing protein [Eubacteriaceae bacterium]|nr:LPXTG cell wall anchor domain-containing protein [Eubacteriaceae bacterium]
MARQIIAFIAFSLILCSAIPPTANASSQQYTVHGRIFADDTQQPVAAIAQLVGPDGKNIGHPIAAAPDGHISIASANPMSQAMLKASMPGYKTAYSMPFDIIGHTAGIYLFLKRDAASLEYSLSYDASGSDEGNVPSQQKLFPPTSLATVLGNTGSLSKAGHEFAGWRSSEDMRVYKAGDQIAILSDTVLSPVWKPARAGQAAKLPASELPTAGLTISDLPEPSKQSGDPGSESSEGPDAGNPQTGDTGKLATYAGIAVASGAVGIAAYKRKRE